METWADYKILKSYNSNKTFFIGVFLSNHYWTSERNVAINDAMFLYSVSLFYIMSLPSGSVSLGKS